MPEERSPSCRLQEGIRDLPSLRHHLFGRGSTGEGEREQAEGGQTDEGRENGRLRQSGESGEEVAELADWDRP